MLSCRSKAKGPFFSGLSIVVIANGFFKPNVSCLVGELYHEHDPRRDGGFTLFYMGINIGSLIPPLFAGALVAAYTWGSGFLLASAGMVVALITFLSGQKTSARIGRNPKHQPSSQKRFDEDPFLPVFGFGDSRRHRDPPPAFYLSERSRCGFGSRFFSDDCRGALFSI